jgi:hypothetical protein
MRIDIEIVIVALMNAALNTRNGKQGQKHGFTEVEMVIESPK